MTKYELIKNYPILGDKEFRLTLQSIVNLFSRDDLADDRGQMVDFFDNWSDSDGDGFFYEMLNHITFILQGATAYTTPDKIIALNYPMDKHPDMVPQDNDRWRRWYFIYCHECLHQLWDTFAVGDEIKKEKGSYNHQLLNIASDCVINDYLANINKSHKLSPIGGITPEVIKKEYGIIYNRNEDTQYSLYCKIMKLAEEKRKEMIEKYGDDGTFDGKKIKPKDIMQGPGGDSGPDGGAPQIYSDDYVKGYTTAIKDVVDKKIDPLKDTPKKTGNDEYDKGYAAAIEEIKKGLEEGIQIGSGSSNENQPNSNLPQIPWDQDNQQQDNSSSSSSSSDSNNDSSDNSSSSGGDSDSKASEAADKAQEHADKAKQAAKDGDKETARDEAKKAAEAAKEAAKQSQNKDAAQKANDAAQNAENIADDDCTAEEAADAAQKAADAAKNAAKSSQSESAESIAEGAQRAADAAKDMVKSAKDNDAPSSVVNKAQKAADEAQQAADEAKQAAKDGDIDKAKQAADKAHKKAKDVNDTINDTLSEEEIASAINEIKKHGEDTCKKYSQKISGKFGDFVKKCKVSKQLKERGLAMDSSRGSGAWNKELEVKCEAFVRQKLKSRKIYKPTYNRVRRGAKSYDPSNGTYLIAQGREEVKNKIGFDMNIFIDTSGSMGSVINKVFKAAYSIVDSLFEKFGKIQNVEKSKVNKRTFIFDTKMTKIKYGETRPASGSTYSFEKLISDIYDNGDTAFLNIIITDGDFNGINNDKVAEMIKKSEGLYIMVTNNSKGTFDRTERAVHQKCGLEKLQVIYADHDFTIK